MTPTIFRLKGTGKLLRQTRSLAIPAFADPVYLNRSRYVVRDRCFHYPVSGENYITIYLTQL